MIKNIKLFQKQFIIAFVFLAVFFFIKYIPFKGYQQDSLLKNIPLEDQLELKILFCDGIFRHQLGYTLFGNKPISIMGYFTDIPWGNILWGASKAQLSNCWKAWKKYKHLFPIKNYILMDEAQSSMGMRTITLINKKSFLKIIQEHLGFFKEKLGKDFTPEKFLDELSMEGANLFDLLHRDETLYGILLGFGKNNAQLFVRNFELMKSLMSYEYFGDKISLNYPKPSIGFQSLQEESEFLTKKLLSYPQPEDLNSKVYFIRPVFFGGDKDDPETILLHKKYERMRRKLIKIYSNGNLLEVTLRQLTS